MSFGNTFDGYCVIHTESARDRRTWFEQELARVGVNDYKIFDASPVGDTDPRLDNYAKRGRGNSAFTISLIDTFIAVIDHAQSQEWRNVVIFEDDIVFRDKFSEWWAEIEPEVTRFAWDMLFLHRRWKGLVVEPVGRTRLLPIEKNNCTHCVILSAGIYSIYREALRLCVDQGDPADASTAYRYLREKQCQILATSRNLSGQKSGFRSARNKRKGADGFLSEFQEFDAEQTQKAALRRSKRSNRKTVASEFEVEQSLTRRLRSALRHDVLSWLNSGIESIRETISPYRGTYVYQTEGFYLDPHRSPSDEFTYYLISQKRKEAYPINDTTAMIWNCCRRSILISDLQQMIARRYPEVRSIEKQVLEILKQFHDFGLVKFTRDRCRRKHFAVHYAPQSGHPSDKARRLVDFCLGDYKDNPIPSCTRDFNYLNNKTILLLEADSKGAELSTGLASPGVRDQKKVVEALISQRAEIPEHLRCWVVRGDSSGRDSDSDQGVHIAGMRHASRRHLVLVPSACRDRYLGPNLANQMEELQQYWIPWHEKSDKAWWGGALTGDWWSKNEPISLTRREVLYYFRDNPSDRVRLDLTELGSQEQPPGIELKQRFTKQYAFSHKCLVLLPGNDIASGSSWYFSGNSVVMMPPPHLEHILYFEMEPWEHYLPLERDPKDILVKLDWVLNNQSEAQQIVRNSHQRLRWLYGPEYQWACNEVLRRIAGPSPTTRNPVNRSLAD